MYEVCLLYLLRKLRELVRVLGLKGEPSAGNLGLMTLAGGGGIFLGGSGLGAEVFVDGAAVGKMAGIFVDGVVVGRVAVIFVDGAVVGGVAVSTL